MENKPEEDHPGWRLRWLLNPQEGKQASEFYMLLKKQFSLDANKRLIHWQKFYKKHPRTIFRDQVTEFIEYCNRVKQYQEIFVDSVKDCYLSFSQKRTLENLRAKIRIEDAQEVNKKVERYVQQLDCGETLQQMLRE